MLGCQVNYLYLIPLSVQVIPLAHKKDIIRYIVDNDSSILVMELRQTFINILGKLTGDLCI